MLRHVLRGREGQTIVLVAVFMLALLAILALAIDVGHVYAERRRMQNAADAGALAGAREICFGDQSAAALTAQQYAEDNGAETVEVLIEHTGAYVVDVTAEETTRTYFAAIFGIDSADVGASAAAVCGAASNACGLWPVAFDVQIWEELVPKGCGKIFYVWTGDNPNNNPDCEVYNCDTDGDGEDDVVGMFGRAWLDFSGIADVEHPENSCVSPGCGFSELDCWLRNDTGAQIELPACIAGDTGVRAAARKAVESRVYDSVSIPLFDYTGCAGAQCPGTSVHAIGFGCVTVMGWEQQLTLERLDGLNPPWKDKAIEVALCGTCSTYCGGSVGDPVSPYTIRAVSLIR
jgi:Flp pilus assembly protein TadG